MGKSDSPQAKKEKTPIELDELQQLKAENLKLRIEETAFRGGSASEWSSQRYMNMDHLREMDLQRTTNEQAC